MGILSGLWNVIKTIAPNVVSAVTNAVTTIANTVMGMIQGNAELPQPPAQSASQPRPPAAPAGPSPEEIHQQQINRRARRFDRDIGRKARPALDDDARFYDELTPDTAADFRGRINPADLILAAASNPVIYGLVEMMKHERPTLAAFMQHPVRSTADTLRLLFADAVHYEHFTAEAVAFLEQSNLSFLLQEGDEIPNTHGDRSEEYSLWSAQLRMLAPPVRDIQFYDAAAKATFLLSILEEGSFLGDVFNIFSLGAYKREYRNANTFLDSVVGERLYTLNRDIFSRLVSGELVTEEGLLISPYSSEPVESPLDWDIHMVWEEQRAVQTALDEARESHQITTRDVERISRYLNMDDPVLLPYNPSKILIEQFDDGIDWAESMLGTDVTFDEVNHRRAIGIAIIFQEHGLSYNDYEAYVIRMTELDQPIPVSSVSEINYMYNFSFESAGYSGGSGYGGGSAGFG